MTVAELLDLLSKQVPEFTSKVLFHEYSQSVVMIAKKALKSDFASIKSDGSRCIEGSRYQLWEKAGIITIVAKDNRGEILRVYNGHTEWNLLPKDVKAFQLFEQHLEQEITQLRNRKFKPDRLKFTEEC